MLIIAHRRRRKKRVFLRQSKTFSAIVSWIIWASEEMVETTWKEVEEAALLSK
jgi:hypothetical protein